MGHLPLGSPLSFILRLHASFYFTFELTINCNLTKLTNDLIKSLVRLVFFFQISMPIERFIDTPLSEYSL